MRYVLMAMIMVLTCLDLNTAQAIPHDRRESLRGLPGVQVLIEEIRPDAQANGLSEEMIRTAVELILRSSGIPVLSRSERETTPSGPLLYVRVSTFKREHSYSVHIGLELNQLVSLVHRPEHMMGAATWQIGTTGMGGEDNLREVIPKVIEPLVKKFANDFLAVNPR